MLKAIIVEDDLMVTEINKNYVLKTKKIIVCATFTNGADALKYLECNNVDLVILDLYMPNLSGMKLLEMIRKNNYSTDVIMVTAANDIDNIDKALKLGILDYLIKPFKYERFQSAINKFLMKYEMISNKKKLNQSSIDELISSNSKTFKTNDDSLSKGLQKETLNLIRDYMTSNKFRYLTSEEISSAINLSKVTIRRYMNYLIENNEISSDVDYKTGGRPSIRYKTLKY